MTRSLLVLAIRRCGRTRLSGSVASRWHDDDIFFAGVVGQAAAVRDGSISSRELVAATLDRIQRYDGQLNAFTAVMAEEALAEADARDAQAGEPRPAARRTGRDQGGDRRRRPGDHLRRPGQRDAGGRRRRGGAPAARGRRGRGRQDQHAGVRPVAVHRVGRARHHPQPLGPRRARPAARAAAPRPRSPRAWCRSASAATAAARSGSRRRAAGSSASSRSAAGSPARRTPHLWWALGTTGPLTRSVRRQRARLRRDPRQPARRPVPRRGAGHVVRRRGPRRGRPAADRLVDQGGRPPGVRPDPEHVRAVEETAALLAVARPPTSRRCDPATPTRPRRSSRSSSPACAPRPTRVEHPDRLERRTRETVRLGAWVRPRVLRVGDAAGREAGREGQPGLRRPSTCCSPRPSRTGPREVGRARRRGRGARLAASRASR